MGFTVTLSFLLLTGLFHVEAHAVIGNHNLIGTVGFHRGDLHGSAVFLHADPVLYRIFHQWLDGEDRKFKIRGLDIVLHIQRIGKPQLFDIKIILKMLKLHLEGHRCLLFQCIHVRSEVLCKCDGRLFSRLRIDITEDRNRGQCIIDKVGPDLRDHDLDLCLKPFLLRPFPFAGDTDIFSRIMIDLQGQIGNGIRKVSQFILYSDPVHLSDDLRTVLVTGILQDRFLHFRSGTDRFSVKEDQQHRQNQGDPPDADDQSFSYRPGK